LVRTILCYDCKTLELKKELFRLEQKVQNASLQFDLYIPEEDTNNIDKEVICCELETELETNQLPFHSVPIFKACLIISA
jgi:hypothetical protein